MSEFKKTEKNKIRRIPTRADYNKEIIYQIIDQTILCHVAFLVKNEPFIIPMVFCRDGNKIILHGAKASRILKTLKTGISVTISFTTIQAYVMARSAFHHSVNYKSVVIFGKGHELSDREQKNSAMEKLVEHICAGRWDDCRKPNNKELNATTIVEIEIEDASAKLRTGPAIDDDEDYSLEHWAGLINIQQEAHLIRDEKLKGKIKTPNYLKDFNIKY